MTTNHSDSQQTHSHETQGLANGFAPLNASSSSGTFGSSAFWKGALLGAGVALLVTNDTVQKTVVKAVSRAMEVAVSGVEEIKEKFEDARAEAEAEASVNGEDEN